MKISVVIITHNEEANIRRCLESIAFADEIIVIDSFSRDDTCKIALSYTSNNNKKEMGGVFKTEKLRHFPCKE